MPSIPLTDFTARLGDVDEILQARDAICPPGAGRPAQRRGAAVLRGAVVLLSAALEAYVEDVYDRAVDLLFAGQPNADRQALKNDTSGRMNNASPFKVNRLYFNVGMEWILQDPKLHWQKFNNQRVQETLGDIVTARNRIAHRAVHSVRKPTVVKWRTYAERMTRIFDEVVSDRIELRTGTRPW